EHDQAAIATLREQRAGAGDLFGQFLDAGRDVEVQRVVDDVAGAPELLQGATQLRLEDHRDGNQERRDGVLEQPVEDGELKEIAHRRRVQEDDQDAAHQLV